MVNLLVNSLRIAINTAVVLTAIITQGLEYFAILKFTMEYEETIHIATKVQYLKLPITYSLFGLLTLFVLIYYVRRRYRLYQAIKRVPRELLYEESYRNHLKNLKLRCAIHNFIIIILGMELVRSIIYVIRFLPYYYYYFATPSKATEDLLGKVADISLLILDPITYTFVPLLSLLMKFLWLAYRHYDYKYTIIRWAWYMVLRTVLGISREFVPRYLSYGYSHTFLFFARTFFGFIFIFDFMQYVYYSRIFYLHLKSREKEIRLFYFDKKAYLDIRFTRIHFMVATILVGFALFFFTLSFSTSQLSHAMKDLFRTTTLLRSYWREIQGLGEYVVVFVSYPSASVCLFLFMINYFYMFVVIVYSSYRKRQKLLNINDYIKPIIQQYHETCYNHN